MPPPETFVYRQTHHPTIPNYVCVDKIPAKPPPPPLTALLTSPLTGTLWTPAMSKSDFGQISAVAYPLRRACPHTCPPSHTRPPVRH